MNQKRRNWPPQILIALSPKRSNKKITNRLQKYDIMRLILAPLSYHLAPIKLITLPSNRVLQAVATRILSNNLDF